MAGDQFWYYALRRRIQWLDRYPKLSRHRDAVLARIMANRNRMILASRFLPGLRVAIPIACAYAAVPALRFSLLNLVSAFAWASAIMLLVVKVGPGALASIGLSGWWAPIVPAALVLIFVRWLGRPTKAS
jgi:membrane protein DedA with SNARE-associated domain